MTKKYEYVVKQLEYEIFNKEYEATNKLPTEEELMKRFDVSKNTVRKAIELLVRKGYIYQVQGSGVFLRNISNPGYLMMTDIQGLDKISKKYNSSRKILSLSIIEADEELSNRMKCSLGAKIYHLKRLRCINNVPFEIEESFYNKDIIPYLNTEICNSSIFKYIQDDLKLKIGFTDRILSCDKLNVEDASLFKLDINDPCLIIDSSVFLNNGTLFLISKNKYNYRETKILSLGLS
jgi:GntR family transcriptional regulator of bglA